MNHIKSELWSLYILDQLSPHQRVEIEEHLYACDECLAVYMEHITENQHHLPHIEDEVAFTDEVVTLFEEQLQNNHNRGAQHQLVKQHDVQSPKMIKHFYQSSFFQYGIAAAATLILMFTGIFEDITNQVSNVVEITTVNRAEPVSEQVLKKAISLLDAIQTTTEGGKMNE